ncbi:hypothetical protein HELRODRAFT_108618, partial [Helobdella robusta]|uniref:FAM20 C-terminal domain-containing protein n=1 Tax=Helobdella robusta TaxID=6412 RepID=T1EEL1_HELRO
MPQRQATPSSSSSSSSLPSSSNIRTGVLLVMVVCILTYSMVIDFKGNIDLDDFIDYEEIEQEMESYNPVQIVKYKSPIDERLFIPWPPGVSYNEFEFKHSKNLNMLMGRQLEDGDRQSKYQTCHNAKQSNERTKRFNQIWESADRMISRQGLWDPESAIYRDVLDALATACIVNVEVLDREEYESGTGDKWVVTLEGGQKAMLKIVWESKGDMKKGGLCNDGFEMPTSEIAAFHLHRILGFHNVPIVVGRRLDLLKDIRPNASPAVARQIKITETLAGNESCVRGFCLYCKQEHSLCPRDNIIEVSLTYWVPRRLKLHTKPDLFMPYSTSRMEKWSVYGFNNKTYCDEVRQTIEPYEEVGMYLDLFDFSVLDTLMYHFDTKHYTVDDGSSAHGLTVRLDHGRAFCAYDKHEKHIFLAPVYQCCTLRKSTYENLLKLRGGKLSEMMKAALKSDPLAPILKSVWYTVLDDRLRIILELIDKCISRNGSRQVLIVGK